MTFGTQLEPTCDGLAQKYRLCWHAAHRYILLLIREVNLIWNGSWRADRTVKTARVHYLSTSAFRKRTSYQTTFYPEERGA
ncbi:hypothetical protein SCLCIDRAFT_450483 [Scleroderma citrinum Foug A]|uniref:Uncharacterized protein n=1 Tax=Scleroderma citrinum Foug A TaxID=1036808 RepID=A0A0C2YUF6_9AGAM|nr:hypothetical protein SCLCIDRAFT_450483 [Scleroderma citrinum Foug A]